MYRLGLRVWGRRGHQEKLRPREEDADSKVWHGIYLVFSCIFMKGVLWYVYIYI